MIHVLDFNDNIIDFISRDDGALISGKITINAEDNSEMFDFIVTNDRAEHLRERNRIIVQDMNGEYREFVIIRITDAFEDTTEVECNASYLEDINTARPIAPGKYKAMSTTQALTEVLANTGWEVSDETEHGGFRTTSWTAYATPYELINQLGTTYGMQASYYVELGSHTVEHRYVKLAKPNPLFKGKEIVKGKDLTGLTRTIDTSAIKTALIALGPEPESGERMEVIVKDDEAQAQFGLPNRYLWGVYEPESTDENMTKERLTTLAENKLDKQKQMAITYEITSVDIHRYYQDQAVYLHDIIRVKDRDFKPALYVEAEVIGYEYDVVGDESLYTFGNIVEYSESSLRSDFEKRLSDIRKMMSDNISNVNTIVADVVAGQLEYFEPKIFKQETAPDNPVEDMLWYDTSNPNVAVLRRFHNGEWINETAQNVKQLGGLTREETLFNSLTNTFQNLNIQHSQLLENVSALQNSEYLIDTDLKQRLNTATDAVINVYQHIKSNLDGMTPETATIGNLIDTQALFQDYRERLQDLYKAMRNAQVSADKRLQLLQSQYTNEKFNDAMNNIAKTLPGGYWDPEKQQLIGDIPNKDDLAQLQDTLKQYTAGQIDSLSSAIGQQTDSKINQAKDEISASVNSVKKDIEQSTDDKLKPITTRVTDSESSIKVLQDGLQLTATKNDVQQTINENLEPIKNQVNQQQATLDVLPSQIASKVSKSDYTTDQNNIVSRLNNADSERVQMANSIADKVTLKEFNDLINTTTNLFNVTNFENGTFYTATGLPAGITNDRLRSIDFIDISSHEYTMKVHNVPNDKVLQIVFYQYDQNGIYLKNSTFTDVNDTLTTTFDSDVKKVKMLLRYNDSAPISQSDLANMNIKFEVGNIANPFAVNPDDMERRLNILNTSLQQNGRDIQLRATSEEFNASRKTLSKVVSDLTVNTTTGITLSYDENGAIQSSTVGPEGVKIRGDKVDIAVNKEFQVLAGNVDNKVGKGEIINRLNLSPEGLDINVNKIGIRGGDATNYINIKNNDILSYGKFERSWAGQKDTANLELGISNGRVLVRNQTTGYRLYLTERGLSTMMDGFSDDTSGTLEFHSKRFNDTSRGITMHSTYGAVAMLSEQSRAYVRANLTTNIESYAYGVYVRPYVNTRPGINEFNFYIKDNDGAGNTDGCILFGEVSDEKGLAGSGLRFKKGGVRGYDSMESIIYATDNEGNINKGSFQASKFYGDFQSRSGYLYLMADDRVRITDYKGYNGGNPTYGDLQCHWIQSESIRTTSTNFYIGTSTGEVRVTNNLLHNSGNIGYKPIKAEDFIKASSVKFKKDINKWDYDALQVISNELQLYSYKYKDDERSLIQHGPIIGEGYETPVEFIFGDGVNTNEMLSWSLRAIQQLHDITKKQNEKIEQLEAKINGTK
ncbi:hypothetical protein NW133_07430 [Staphylococcus pettenkoferi]|uniref:Peptidase S74 domain-containing protein n=1 Tax=Staphylococcus pettenkoferi TaxID=170573 RepID=A0ABT4BML2_9STAP|nr:phage tail spike protein [Staphylococcus pettenkoferi]MCY1583359.1 hypothetical protein [Staphylococcus pettenkoferi]